MLRREKPVQRFAKIAKITVTVLLGIWAFTPLSLAFNLQKQGRIAEAFPWFFLGLFFLSLPLLAKLRFWRSHPARDPIPSSVPLHRHEQPGHTNSAMIQIFAAQDRVKAQAIRIALEQLKIPCFLFDQHTAGLLPFLPQVPVRIMVPSGVAQDRHLTIQAVLRRFGVE